MRNNRFWPGLAALIVAGLLYLWLFADADTVATLMSPFGGGHLRR